MIIRTEKELSILRENGRIHAEVFRELRPMLVPGATGLELDRRAGEICKKYGVKPAFRGVYGFPANLCVSVNDEVVHGIPDGDPFQAGDVVKVDFGVLGGGLYTDAAFTVQVGEPKDPEVERFLRTCEECRERGVAQAKAGNRVGDIGHAVQSHAEAMGYHVVRELTGHGLAPYTPSEDHRGLHDDPHVYNYGRPGTGPVLEEGMLICIEPILGMTTGKIAQPSEFRIVMRDGGLGAQFEHTVVVGKRGAEIII